MSALAARRERGSGFLDEGFHHLTQIRRDQFAALVQHEMGDGADHELVAHGGAATG